MRRWLPALALVIACGGDDAPAPPLPEVTDPLPLVDPTIGTGGLGFGYGSSFVGAAVPHGLVKLGPDTSGDFGTVAFQHFSGYFFDDDTIEQFTHLHLHGAGASSPPHAITKARAGSQRRMAGCYRTGQPGGSW